MIPGLGLGKPGICFTWSLRLGIQERSPSQREEHDKHSFRCTEFEAPTGLPVLRNFLLIDQLSLIPSLTLI